MAPFMRVRSHFRCVHFSISPCSNSKATAWLDVFVLLFYVLATSKVISGWVPPCDNAHSWQLYSAASLGHQAAGTITCYPRMGCGRSTNANALKEPRRAKNKRERMLLMHY